MATKSTKKPASSGSSSSPSTNGNNGNSDRKTNGADAQALNGQSPVATTGMSDAPKSGSEQKFEQMEEHAVDMQELISMPVTPSSMEQMPNGAKLTGPRQDGSRSFRGTLEQAGVDKETLLAWYKEMDLGRIADTQAANYLKKAMGWSYHAPCAGHEGIQLAIGKSFRRKQDYLFPYYRDLMTCLAAGLTVEEIIWNGLSKDTDIAGGGRHMSNHFAKQEFNIQNVSSLTNNHAQHVAGTARALKYYKKDAVAVFSAGESGTSEGYFYEAVNGATREKTPAIFVLQNNKYGISVPVWDQTANVRVADNFRGFNNLLISYCDGTDVLDSYRAMQEAYEWCSSGKGAAMVHADCVRMGSHSNSDRHELYRTDKELSTVKERDPLRTFGNWLIKVGIATEDSLKKVHDENVKYFSDVADKAEAAPAANPATIHDFVLADNKIVSQAPYTFQPDDISTKFYPFHIPTGKTEGMQFIEGINQTLKEEFRLNANTFIWGQDVAYKDKGGIFNVTKGMQPEFGPKRVFNGPIAEDFILGTANGFTRVDQETIWCVVEGAEFADYFWPAMEQFIETTHEYWRTRGQFCPNIVVRLASGGFIGGGLYHSQNIEASITPIPGVRIVVPSFADDAQGLLRTAMRTRGFTMYLEPKFLYYSQMAKAMPLAENELVPFGKARLRHEGQHISMITYGTTTHFCLQAAAELEKQGIIADVLDLRSLWPLDEEAVLATIKKTGRALIVHEDKVHAGFGGELAAILSEKAFEHLDAPIMRVGSEFTPVGFSKILEEAILPNPKKVLEAALKLAKY